MLKIIIQHINIDGTIAGLPEYDRNIIVRREDDLLQRNCTKLSSYFFVFITLMCFQILNSAL